jgi:hypothetical protein
VRSPACRTTPKGCREAFVTGGLPALRQSPEKVYRAAYPRVERKNAAHYARHPEDVGAAREIARHLRDNEVLLPAEGRLTTGVLQSLGMLLGTADGSHTLHYLLEEAFVEGPGGAELSDTFLAAVQQRVSFVSNPLYAVLHESCYAQRSADSGCTGWAAEAVRAEFPLFDVDKALAGDGPVLFTGEMIYPWMFATDPALGPLAETAQELALAGNWPDLYSPATRSRSPRPSTTTTCTSTRPTPWRRPGR